MNRVFMVAIAILPIMAYAKFEDTVVRLIDGLKESVDDCKKRDDGGAREAISIFQTTVDDSFEIVGVAQNHAGYYREQINSLDAANVDFAGIRNSISTARVRLARAESLVSEYHTWYERLCSKANQIIGIRNRFLRDNDYASWEWIKENYVVENFIATVRTYSVAPLTYLVNGGMDGLSFTLNYSDGLPSPNIKYGDRRCNGQCDCRRVYEFDGLAAAQNLQEKFESLASKWEQFNKVNDIPD